MNKPLLSMAAIKSSRILFLLEIIGWKLLVIILLMFLASILESIGLLMMLPMLSENKYVDSNYDDPSGVFSAFKRMTEGFSSVELIWLVIFLFLAKGIIVLFALSYKSILEGKILNNLKNLSFEALLATKYEDYIIKDSSYFINIINRQTESTVSAANSFTQIVIHVLQSAIFFVLVFTLSGVVAIYLAVAGIFIFFLFHKINMYVKKISKLTLAAEHRAINLIIQVVQSFKYIIATGRQRALSGAVQNNFNDYAQLRVKTNVARSVTASLKEPLTAILGLSYIYHQHVLNNVSIEELVVSIAFLYRASQSLMATVALYQGYLNQSASLDVLRELRVMSLIEDDPVMCSNNKLLSGEIEFSNVSYKYPASKNFTLEDISIKIQKNSIVAFVGCSGSGKTTIVDLITGTLQPTMGSIYLDKIDVKNFDKFSLSTALAYVSQDLILFEGSIIWNITLESEVSDQRWLEEVIEISGVQEFVNDLDLGLDTVIGERGLGLSGGQKQRIFIARELYKNPKVLIFDEATSALDRKNEKLIMRAIEKMTGRVTVIIVTHNPDVAKIADHIYTVKNRKICNYLEAEN